MEKKFQSFETLFKFQEFHWKVIASLELIPEFLGSFWIKRKEENINCPKKIPKEKIAMKI